MTTPTLSNFDVRTPSFVGVLVMALALSGCGGGKATSAEPNLVPPGAPRAADIQPVTNEQTSGPAPSASSPSAPASSPSGTASNPTPSASVSASSGGAAVPTSLKSQIAALERSGSLPALYRSASITGPDTNSNGVRDDIEGYIASLPLSAAQKRAAMQDARATQATLVVDLSDKVALQKVGDGLMASSKCLGAVFAPDIAAMADMSGKIESITANTKARAQRYIQYNSARSGSVTSMPDGDACEK